MILQKILTTEQQLKQELKFSKQKLATLENIKGYLNKIDHAVEVIPTHDVSKLSFLISELKESELSKDEELMVGEVFGR